MKGAGGGGGEGEDFGVEGVDGGFVAVAADIGGDAVHVLAVSVDSVDLRGAAGIAREVDLLSIGGPGGGGFEGFGGGEAFRGMAVAECGVEFGVAAAGKDHGDLLAVGAEDAAGVGAGVGGEGFLFACGGVDDEDVREAGFEVAGVDDFFAVGGPFRENDVGAVVGELTDAFEEEVADKDFVFIVSLADEGDFAGEEAGDAEDLLYSGVAGFQGGFVEVVGVELFLEVGLVGGIRFDF